MRRIHISLLSALVALIISLTPSQAQSVNFGGTTFNNDIIGWYDLYNLSFTSHNYGTARSMAMGNAFTALGADMVSASLNPAGIGMYVGSDVSITPMMQFTMVNCIIGVMLTSLPTYIPIPAGLSDADTISAPRAVKALPIAIERAVP